jgi:hypothetical protein
LDTPTFHRSPEAHAKRLPANQGSRVPVERIVHEESYVIDPRDVAKKEKKEKKRKASFAASPLAPLPWMTFQPISTQADR